MQLAQKSPLVAIDFTPIMDGEDLPTGRFCGPFALLKGQGAGLWGENGCGKTSWVRSLKKKWSLQQNPPVRLAFLDQQSYQTFYNCDVHTLLRELFSTPDANTLWGNSCEQRARLLLKEIDFESLLSSNVGHLSGGQWQVLKWTLLLLQRFDVAILDEPFQQLDEKKRAWVVSKMKQWIQEEKSFLLIDHDRSRLAQLCESCYEVVADEEYRSLTFRRMT